MIPKRLHFIWVGPKPLPDEARARIKQAIQLMPDFEVKVWGNEALDFTSRYVREAIAAGAWQRVSDYMRLVILERDGGVYLDTDIGARRSLTPLLDQSCFFGLQTTTGNECANNAVVGAEAGHWFIRELSSVFETELRGYQNRNAFSGPGLVTERLRSYGEIATSDQPVRIKDITLYPPRYFYPFLWNEAFSESCVTPDTYLIHYWDFSWGHKNRILRLIARGKNALLALYIQLFPLAAFRRAYRRNRLSKTTKI